MSLLLAGRKNRFVVSYYDLFTHKRSMKHLLSATLSLSILASIVPAVSAQEAAYEQNFVITAYYSPLPGQCCYVKGDLTADRILNGNGTNGADGTEVYPGMIAAPKTYAFGTRIKLPGIGVGTVHDRGGAIIEQGATHRLDLWAGHGEEGLARALAFGVRRMRGTVYPKGTDQPANDMPLKKLSAPLERLKPFLITNDGLMDLHAKHGDYGLTVLILQEHLKTLGYFEGPLTGSFGDVTKAALGAFLSDMKLEEPSDQLTVRTAAYVLAALQEQADEPRLGMVGPDSPAQEIKNAQRLLRYLGHYRGRTNGVYDDKVFQAILAFQQRTQLVGTKESPGAGRIGPMTKGKLSEEWRRKQVAMKAEQYLLLRRVNETLAKKGILITQFLQKGSNGPQVVRLQQLLAQQGLFPADKINGNFGDLTAQSLMKYQIAAGLIKGAGDPGAGTIGPFTLRKLREQLVRESYRTVRGFGLEAL
jgi:peptidoglycan hydrolase-like protein with peptidoglycan-binding domain/3D (Asp-Asp-Asp) domain-containing protein